MTTVVLGSGKVSADTVATLEEFDKNGEVLHTKQLSVNKLFEMDGVVYGGEGSYYLCDDSQNLMARAARKNYLIVKNSYYGLNKYYKNNSLVLFATDGEDTVIHSFKIKYFWWYSVLIKKATYEYSHNSEKW